MVKDAYYFPHDSNAIQDPKMMTLLSECGLSGIGMFWIIVEILHQQESGFITEEEFKKYLSFYCHFQTEGEQVLNKIEQVLIKTKLLLNKNGFISSERVTKNKQYREDISQKRSFAGKKSGESRSKPTNDEQVLNKSEQGKEKKRKEIKRKESIIIKIDISSQWYQDIKKDFLDIDVDKEFKKMTLWLKDNFRQNHKKTFRNWLIKAQDDKEKKDGRTNKKHAQPDTGKYAGISEVAE